MTFKTLVPILLLLSKIGFGQIYTQSNEELIFSFKTQSGKTMAVSKDKGNKYIIYRFGSAKKIEFEYSEKTPASWKKFTYSFYLRGGGSDNEGLDLNYLYFTKDEFKYIVYQSYYAVTGKTTIGIKVINLKSKQITEIIGNPKTQKGTLSDFRENELIEKGEELFD